MLNETQELSTYKRNETNYLMRLLIRLLKWLSSKITNDEEQVIIVLTKNNPPTFYRTASSITYVPLQATIENVTLKTSDWKMLQHIKSLKLDDVKELIEKFIPGIEVKMETINNTIVLMIDWKQISISFIEDDQDMTMDKRIPIAYRILTYLKRKPSCLVKGRNSFSNRLGMKFDEDKKVAFVGDGSDYLFKENGFNYIGLDNLNNFKKSGCKDCIGIIEHREKDLTRVRYERKVNRYLPR